MPILYSSQIIITFVSARQMQDNIMNFYLLMSESFRICGVPGATTGVEIFFLNNEWQTFNLEAEKDTILLKHEARWVDRDRQRYKSRQTNGVVYKLNIACLLESRARSSQKWVQPTSISNI